MTLNHSLVECGGLEELHVIGKVNSGQYASNVVESRCNEVTKFDSVVLRTHRRASSGGNSSGTYSRTKTTTTRNVQRLVLHEKSRSSPAIIAPQSRGGGLTRQGRVENNAMKEKRDRMRSGWKMKERHVSFDECVHVVTKCAVIEMPLKNSTWFIGSTGSRPSNGCDMCRASKDGVASPPVKNVTFGWEEMVKAAVLEQDLSEVERMCKQRGACFNKKLSNGLTLLHLASIGGCFRIIQYILKHGCHVVDERDDNGWTALHYAALHSNVPCALALLRAGADINARTGDRRTVIELASADEMILLLGRMMHCGNALSKQKINDNKETYV